MFGGGALIGEAMAKRAKVEAISYSPGFLEFWNEWPAHFRKVDKPRCFQKWQSLGLEAIRPRVIAAVKLWKRSDLWRKDNGQFIVAPLVWLNQGRFEVTIESFPELRQRGQSAIDKFKPGVELYDS